MNGNGINKQPNGEFQRALNRWEKRTSHMRKFVMYRKNDASGVSGTGAVLEGVIFSNGKVSVSWLTRVSSTANYDSFEDFKAIHINAHPFNKSHIVWKE